MKVYVTCKNCFLLSYELNICNAFEVVPWWFKCNLNLKKKFGVNVVVLSLQVTRLIPNANGTTCNQRIEKLEGTKYSRILRVPFRHKDGILQNWISRFDVYPFLEKFVMVSFPIIINLFFVAPAASLFDAAGSL